MLGYYPNISAKPRGSNLNGKIQTFISLTFHKHLCWLTYIDKGKHTNKHKYTQHIHIHIHTHAYIHTHKHTHMYAYI